MVGVAVAGLDIRRFGLRFGNRLSVVFLRHGAARPSGQLALGAAFAFCWTPCASPLLASVLTLASASASLRSGVILLAVYGAGLAVPFLATGMAFGTAFTCLRRLRRYQRLLALSTGLVLVLTGGLLLGGCFSLVYDLSPRL